MSDEELEKKQDGEDGEDSRPERPEALPLLLTFTFSVAQLVVILVGLAVMLVSLISGATLFTATVRSAAAVLAVGLLLWWVNWLLSKHSLEVVRREIRKNLREMKAKVNNTGDYEGSSTFEKVA